MEAKVTWKGKMHFDGAAESGIAVPLDSDLQFGGENSGSRPMELIAIGLAGCTAMDVISILEKKRQAVTAFEVLAHIQRATEHPKVFTEVELEYIVTGKAIDTDALERAIELSETRYCPAQAMLAQSVKITHRYTVHEAKTQKK